MGRFFVEHLVRLHREFDGDLEQVILLGEIGHHNASQLGTSKARAARGRGRGEERPELLPAQGLPRRPHVA